MPKIDVLTGKKLKPQPYTTEYCVNTFLRYGITRKSLKATSMSKGQIINKHTVNGKECESMWSSSFFNECWYINYHPTAAKQFAKQNATLGVGLIQINEDKFYPVFFLHF